MLSGLTLVLAILVLGGVIATIGDRLGSKIGKARLSLFNLRPKQTAVVLTIFTGSLISASTLGILFATNSQLRNGVFQYEAVQNRLRKARAELAVSKLAVEQSQRQRDQAQRRQKQARRELAQTEAGLRAAVARQQQTAAQLRTADAQLQKLRRDVPQLIAQRQALEVQRRQVQKELLALRGQLEQRDRDILARQARVRELEERQSSLSRDIQQLEQAIIAFRQGNVALTRGQVLVSRIVRVLQPSQARLAIDAVLREANRVAFQATRPGQQEAKEQVIQITQTDVERLTQELRRGQSTVVRILAATNVVVGERRVLVFGDASPNQLVIPAGKVLVSNRIEPTGLDDDELRQRINLLLTASQLKARRDGNLSDQLEVGDGNLETLVRFVQQLRSLSGSVTLEAVASSSIYTADPVRLQLRAVQNGVVRVST